jgi:beta-glucosidase
LRAGEALDIALDVTNEGPSAGEEKVFLFIRDLVSSVTRPFLELKGFQSLFIEAGDCRTVNFRLTAESLGLLDHDLSPKLEPGSFDICVGSSAAPETLLSARIQLVA